jgi:hypothetical protein
VTVVSALTESVAARMAVLRRRQERATRTETMHAEPTAMTQPRRTPWGMCTARLRASRWIWPNPTTGPSAGPVGLVGTDNHDEGRRTDGAK